MHRTRIEHEPEAIVVTAVGEFDAYSAPALAESLDEAARDDRQRLVADLSRVSFLDSTALGLVVRTVNGLVKRGGHARVVLPDTTARRIFEITTLDRNLPTAASRAEALRQLHLIGADAPDDAG